MNHKITRTQYAHDRNGQLVMAKTTIKSTFYGVLSLGLFIFLLGYAALMLTGGNN